VEKWRKVSDEWIVALCRGRHREVHCHGDERGSWEKTGIDPNVAARSLWLQFHPTCYEMLSSGALEVADLKYERVCFASGRA
jgi:hypothetical protein